MSVNENAKNWKSTAVGIVAGLALVLPFLLPDFSTDDAGVVKENANLIINSVEAIIQGVAALWLVFKAKD